MQSLVQPVYTSIEWLARFADLCGNKTQIVDILNRSNISEHSIWNWVDGKNIEYNRMACSLSLFEMLDESRFNVVFIIIFIIYIWKVWSYIVDIRPKHIKFWSYSQPNIAAIIIISRDESQTISVLFNISKRNEYPSTRYHHLYKKKIIKNRIHFLFQYKLAKHHIPSHLTHPQSLNRIFSIVRFQILQHPTNSWPSLI